VVRTYSLWLIVAHAYRQTKLEFKSRIARLIKFMMRMSFIEHFVIGPKLADLIGFEFLN